ncbi:uncharacterized protein V1510DRAFT_196333 [Dipodascopsis tothii]|uniref:uncharacterized protein n=1 Tax=Dipodascopsis tothii TaxID=44089 RepID=UPI0034CFB51E
MTAHAHNGTISPPWTELDEQARPEDKSKYMKAALAAQATRTEIYHEFDDALNDHLAGTISEAQMNQIITIAQEGFQDISLDVSRQQRLLAAVNESIFAGLLTRLQQLEKDNLERTVRLYTLRIRARDDSDISYDEDIAICIQSRNQTLDAINEVLADARAEAAEAVDTEDA